MKKLIATTIIAATALIGPAKADQVVEILAAPACFYFMVASNTNNWNALYIGNSNYSALYGLVVGAKLSGATDFSVNASGTDPNCGWSAVNYLGFFH